MSVFDFEQAEGVLPENERRLLSSTSIRSLKSGEKTTLRILPGWETPQVWYRTFYRHYMFGLDSISIGGRIRRPFLCTLRCFNEPCFFCDLSEALRSSGSEQDQNMGEKIFPWTACLVNAYRVFAEDATVEIYSLSSTVMKNLISIWKEGVNFMDPQAGCPIVFKPVPGTNFFMPEALVQKRGPVPEVMLKGLHNLDETLLRIKVSYMQVAANFSPSVIRIVANYYAQKGVKPPIDFSVLIEPSGLGEADPDLKPSADPSLTSHTLEDSWQTVPQAPASGFAQASSTEDNPPFDYPGTSVQPTTQQPVTQPTTQQPVTQPTTQQPVDDNLRGNQGAQSERSLLDMQMEDLEKVLDEVLS